MKTRNQWRGIKFVAVVMALCAFAISAYSTVLIDEQFESGYNRTSVDIAGGNMAWFKGRSGTVPTVNVGSLSFSASSNGGADGEWGYFTDAGANFAIAGTSSQVSNGHVLLGVGDTIKASITLYLGTMPANTSDASFRFGLLDNAMNLRALTDYNGGPSSTAFTNNPGYAVFSTLTANPQTDSMSILAHTGLTSANLFSASADWTRIDGAGGGEMSGMSSGNPYTLSFSVGRPDSGTWNLTTEIRDALTDTLMESMTVTTNAGVSSFSWIALRFNRMPDSAVAPLAYTDLRVEVIPEPSTLMLLGTGLALAAFAIRRRR